MLVKQLFEEGAFPSDNHFDNLQAHIKIFPSNHTPGPPTDAIAARMIHFTSLPERSFFLLVFIQIHAPSDTINMEEHTLGRSFFTGVPSERARLRHRHGGAPRNAKRSISPASSDEIHADQSLGGLSVFEYVCSARR